MSYELKMGAGLTRIKGAGAARAAHWRPWRKVALDCSLQGGWRPPFWPLGGEG